MPQAAASGSSDSVGLLLNLNKSATWMDLKDILSKHGKVLFVENPRQIRTAVVHFATPADREQVLQALQDRSAEKPAALGNQVDMVPIDGGSSLISPAASMLPGPAGAHGAQVQPYMAYPLEATRPAQLVPFPPRAGQYAGAMWPPDAAAFHPAAHGRRLHAMDAPQPAHTQEAPPHLGAYSHFQGAQYSGQQQDADAYAAMAALQGAGAWVSPGPQQYAGQYGGWGGERMGAPGHDPGGAMHLPSELQQLVQQLAAAQVQGSPQPQPGPHHERSPRHNQGPSAD